MQSTEQSWARTLVTNVWAAIHSMAEPQTSKHVIFVNVFVFIISYIFIFVFPKSTQAYQEGLQNYNVYFIYSASHKNSVALKIRSYLKQPHYEGNKKFSFPTSLLNDHVSGRILAVVTVNVQFSKTEFTVYKGEAGMTMSIAVCKHNS